MILFHILKYSIDSDVHSPIDSYSKLIIKLNTNWCNSWSGEAQELDIDILWLTLTFVFLCFFFMLNIHQMILWRKAADFFNCLFQINLVYNRNAVALLRYFLNSSSQFFHRQVQKHRQYRRKHLWWKAL